MTKTEIIEYLYSINCNADISVEDIAEVLCVAEPDEIDEDWPYTDEDYSSNMPCDFSGYCAGASCPNFFKCKGSIK